MCVCGHTSPPPNPNPNPNPKRTKSNTQLKQEHFYSYILMNLLFEDMTNQHDVDNYTKQIDNPKISFENYMTVTN